MSPQGQTVGNLKTNNRKEADGSVVSAHSSSAKPVYFRDSSEALETSQWARVLWPAVMWTSVVLPEGTPRTPTADIRFRQVTDGRVFTQAVYGGDGVVRDCDVREDRDAIDGFVASFLAEDTTVTDDALRRGLVLESDSLRADYLWTEFSPLVVDGSEGLVSNILTLVDFKTVKGKCREFEKAVKREMHRLREKRDTGGRTKRAGSWLIYPGTKWCGAGDISSKFDDLGEEAEVDRCCREHDHCEHRIPGFSTAYGFFNVRFHTLSHCDCDDRFYNCLQSTRNPVAHMVGKIFFNAGQPPCFDLNEEHGCLKRSWWGGCYKYGMTTLATLRQPMKYEPNKMLPMKNEPSKMIPQDEIINNNNNDDNYNSRSSEERSSKRRPFMSNKPKASKRKVKSKKILRGLMGPTRNIARSYY
ncbi:Phospholipase A2 [Branchiostoma belcheri]|nr:Phospholipase A2 [Branchiostoma belcheri]